MPSAVICVSKKDLLYWRAVSVPINSSKQAIESL